MKALLLMETKKHPAEIQRDRDIRQRYALLLCGEFFRDELEFYEPSARQRKKFQELRDLVFETLGNPSLAEADEIRRDYRSATGVKARCPECRVLWVFSDEDVRVLTEVGGLLDGVEEQSFLCADCGDAPHPTT